MWYRFNEQNHSADFHSILPRDFVRVVDYKYILVNP